jgi:DNA-binding LytR/AlgR family response regulator
MKWKCLIADDEPPATRILEKYISMTAELELAGICQNAFEVLTLLKSQEINLMFLDIHMPKLSGLSLMNSLSSPPRVIFTTAYKEYAANAFEMDAIDYLVKPVSFERFLKAVDKLSRYNSFPAKNTFLPDQNGFLYFRSNRKMVKVFLHDILYIESVKDYIKIFRGSEPPLMIRQSIALTEAMLPSTDFVRVHRSFIVSTKQVTAFTSTDIEIGDIEIPVGRLYGNSLRQLQATRRNDP